jgi:hypothetical protein
MVDSGAVRTPAVGPAIISMIIAAKNLYAHQLQSFHVENDNMDEKELSRGSQIKGIKPLTG